MTNKIKNVTIVKNCKNLSLYGFEHIDESILNILKDTGSKEHKSYLVILYRLNCFLGFSTVLNLIDQT